VVAKAHRAYRRTWWKKSYPFAGMTLSEWLEKMNRNADLPTINRGQKYTPPPLVPYTPPSGTEEGILLNVPLTQQALPSEQNTRHQSQRRLEQSRARREREHLGIPAGVEDALDWYEAYAKLADLRNPDKQVPLTKDGKEDYYRDLVFDLYRASGYSIDDSVKMAYSPQGDELRRYLSDDKRHSLNRNRGTEMEVASETPTN
jgi:hypothetical protein